MGSGLALHWSLIPGVCATDGSLWMWGLNDAGQLGDMRTIDKHHPMRVWACRTFAKIAVGGRRSAALCAGMYVPRRVLLCRSVLPSTRSALRHGSMTRTDMYRLGLHDEGIGAACPRIKNDSASGRRKCNVLPASDPNTLHTTPYAPHYVGVHDVCGAHAMRGFARFLPADTSLKHALPLPHALPPFQ